MTQYVAMINVPGYLPMADEPEVFDTVEEAWEWLAEDRARSEDDVDIWALAEDNPERYEYTETLEDLRSMAKAGVTGTIFGWTPGDVSEYDLGLNYSVTVAE